MQYDQFRAMNSDIVMAASGSDLDQIKRGFTRSRRLIQQFEQRFTRFTDTSELAELNRSAGNWFQATPEMLQVVQEAIRLSTETDGLFNPAILPALKQAGYDRSMDEISNLPARGGMVQLIEMQDFRSIELNSEAGLIRLPDGMQVDLGGIAKGWIAERAARLLAQYAPACAVNAGGDMFLINLPQDEPDWAIGLEDPLHPEHDLALIHVAPGAVATSAVTKRKWQYNGRNQHHLIDPRTGEPAVTEWLSVTVWAAQAVDAEVYAKALLIGGPVVANELFSSQTDKAYLAVDQFGWVLGSKNYHEVFHV
ncbi:MAG TPA: FAD:protein FMN transferase [Anaerolineales bacterium]|nr:FAD:protein FMN transferase [Anaerolineales bacterium]